MIPPNDATLAQIRAADPSLSTWVSANAGSGKTRVLTDRVARLLLQNVPPQRILCLTYTKAAAANMQNQLFERLGEWAMLDDATLTKKLQTLGEDITVLDSAFLGKARTLFARALETPGGLKIQTIHSFCSALLRRFPLEAGVSPQFTEMDERSSLNLRADILDTMAAEEDPSALDALAKYLSGDDVDKIMQEITKQRDAFARKVSAAEIWSKLGLPAEYSEAEYLSRVMPDQSGALLAELENAMRTGKPTDIRNADTLATLSGSRLDMSGAITLETMFVYDETTKQPNAAKLDRVPTKDVREANPELMARVHNLMQRFEAEKPRRLALAVANKTLALHQFARAFLPEYDRLKRLHGWLDFDDLILRARDLLTDSAMAQWVLFRLDGGIDHILVDEAQDTSPEQWDVIARLAEEFSTGQGAREVQRTLFVVGDEKQSIYSFQGADPAAFDRMRLHFEQRLSEAQSKLHRRDLLYSFRSSSAVLELVDVVLKESGRADVSLTVEHRAFHENLPGRVDLWEFKEKPEAEERPAWYEPLDMPPTNDPGLELAREIADTINEILKRKETLVTTSGERLITPGDFLILVQRRSALFHEIIRALKDRGLPVAGADRLRIGGELAVRDLAALLAFMATPEDDLSLACALRSPLLRLSEADLFRLAHGRKRSLWESLRTSKEQFPDAYALLQDMLRWADFLRPYELLERILTRHKGREHLISRLGAEAEDGIDALLLQAMQYEQMAAPSLTGFLGWVATDESDIKRQMDTRSQEIRVMTVHGAKGLEAPIVILPDTAKRKPGTMGEVLALDSGLAVWRTSKLESPEIVKSAISEKESFQQEERMRLLYVAMTRAENWLIVCGAGEQGLGDESWYSLIHSALEEARAENVDFHGRQVLRFQTPGWPENPGAVVQSPVTEERLALPGWCHEPAPPIPENPRPINPSDLGGAKVVANARDGLDEAAAKRRGLLVHALFEHLPLSSSDERFATASRIFSSTGTTTDEVETSELVAEVSAALDNPELAFLFGPNAFAEVPITCKLFDQPMSGVIDRLLVEPDRVLAVDFKSNKDIPLTPADVPEGILRQMGAYSHALTQIYPDRRIELAILWTRNANLMPLPNDLVTDALSRARAP